MLRSFVAVGESLSFIQASERTCISVSATSRRIQRLEDAIGVRLLVRNTREVALTPAGERFLPHARQVLEQLGSAVQDLKDAEQQRATHLALAALPSVTAQLVPSIIRGFSARWPSIHVRLIECGASAVLEKLRDGTADLGLSFRTGREIDLAFDPLGRDPFCLIAPAGHALAAHSVVRWRDLKPYAAITAGASSGNMMLLRDALQGIDWLSDTAYAIDHLTTSLGMVEAGLGISVLPRSAIPSAAEQRLTIRPLVEPTVERQLGLFRRHNAKLAQSARRFLSSARSAFAQAQADQLGS